jgi:Zn ribbon nucleic-acid-binding protein
MAEINHNKRLSEVLSHAKCPRCNSNDKVLMHKNVDMLQGFCDLGVCRDISYHV